MTTVSDIAEAERLCRERCFTFKRHLQINWAKVKPQDEDMISQLRVAQTEKAYIELLATPAVADLFRRKVLYFGGAK